MRKYLILNGLDRASQFHGQKRKKLDWVGRVGGGNRGGAGGAWATGWKGERGTLDSGQSFKEIPDDRGERITVFSCPDPGAAIDIVADGYGDVAHGFSSGRGVLERNQSRRALASFVQGRRSLKAAST